MSARRDTQAAIADFLRETGYFTAPYGVIEGMAPLGAGKKRVVTFGVARLLDASVDILQVNKIVLTGIGPLAREWGIESGKQEFASSEEFIEFINDRINRENNE